MTAPLDLRVPGDKSIAHRALILAALAQGVSRIDNLPAGGDVASTVGFLRDLGADIEREGSSATVHGRGIGSLHAPAAPIDCGNSGTTARLGMGLAAALSGTTTLDGDASLRRRPMERVAEPLIAMGARIEYAAAEGRLPLRVSGGALHALEWRSPVASAQVKSALLIAGVAAGVPVAVHEPAASRDHTERMLRATGHVVVSDEGRVRLEPSTPKPLELTIPGDVSSAAFLVGAALLAERPLVLRALGVNPTRTGFIDILRRMGACVDQHAAREQGGEPVADLRVQPAELVGTEVHGAEVVRAIDELPVVAVLAAHARGRTLVRDAGELRLKESDRIRALCENLRALGVDVAEFEDGFSVLGSDLPLRGRVRSFGDHRIAMAFAVLGTRPGSRIVLDDLDVAGISYPGFAEQIERLRLPNATTGGVA